MASSTSQLPEVQSVVALVKTLTNAQLKDILRNEGLAVSGVKASLQLRIIEYIEGLIRAGKSERYDALRRFIYSTAQRLIPSTQLQPPSHPQYQSHAVMNAQNKQHSFHLQTAAHSFAGGRLMFKDSPFYTIIQPLTSTVECKVREQTRDSVHLRVILTPDITADLQKNQNIRIMFYCTSETGLNQYTKSDIAFPNQVELKANLDDVKANLRGLKNKAGTTQPADITNYIRKKPGYTNDVVMTYALTQKRFFVLVNLVQQHPVEELVNQLKARKTISKEQVLREMQNKANDSEIITTSSVMSLKCPLSTLRIENPCRSTVCTHNQCFDASSFLQLQQQAPTWTCPVCSKATSFESLQIDQYVDDILVSTPNDVDQVIIEPDGRWLSPKGLGSGVGGITPTTDDDDELIEINQPVTPLVKQEPSSIKINIQRTPSQSREPSATSSAARLMTNKRPISQVIDLTGSDDDDDELPVRPMKRPALGGVGRDSLQPENFDPFTSINGGHYEFMGLNHFQPQSPSGGHEA
ncbi:hypothetical protein ASPZODRAFT_135717 [Penicilliopsis zonata CBS 506.65]|uniref:SP-RING-type domain-containing protein n=1 Tax=Penicilliopsis zonata CBS 506.65 TaxID=1073090 RepID=A0A1L9S972_9EURO|nr:hypothetical protein ASPZODRAFT_135717 [Penicilliopsis zonata CBS 506.65]OJJ43713.1 hypothetical protein ASPZODRAFT_135717 [Penicilliopsis zonata CBS 506.65]